MELYKVALPAVILLCLLLVVRSQFDWAIGKATQPSDAGSLFGATTPISAQLCGPASDRCKLWAPTYGRAQFEP